MNKLLSVLIISTLFSVCIAHAEDVPATLSITGAATSEAATCAVVISPETISLESSIDNLPVLGTKTFPQHTVNLHISGNSECYALVGQNHIAYRFLGTGDSVDGSVLANTDTTPEAATGVGVGLYYLDGNPLNIKNIFPATGSDNINVSLVALERDKSKQTAGSVKSTMTIQVERL